MPLSLEQGELPVSPLISGQSVLSELRHIGHISDRFWEELPSYCIVGNLRRHLAFWESIGANPWVLDLIREGYALPFSTIAPPSASFSNNASARNNAVFIESQIFEFLKNGIIQRVSQPPTVVNPLSVACQSSGKLRFILDATYVNEFLAYEHFKLEDLSLFIQYLEGSSFGWSFDISKGYFHIPIAPRSRPYLGFAWRFGEQLQYFVFRVLAFGVATGPLVFSKVMRVLVLKWRREGKKVIVYLDDGLGFHEDRLIAQLQADEVRHDLKAAGFLEQETKCHWRVSQEMVWLGHLLDLEACTISVSHAKITQIVLLISSLLRQARVSGRQLARVAGKIVSLRWVLGDLCSILTKDLMANVAAWVANNPRAWDRHYVISARCRAQLQYWLSVLPQTKPRCITKERSLPHTIVFSDASALSGGAILKPGGQMSLIGWTSEEKNHSSTWRELRAIEHGLMSFAPLLRDKRVFWHTDSQPVFYLVKRGSMKPEINKIAESICQFCFANSIYLEVQWIRREYNQEADQVSRLVDTDDWGLSVEFFQLLAQHWGLPSIDRFANASNAQLCRFNSRFWEPGSEAIDAFSEDWNPDFNWLTPPPCLVIRAIRHLQLCQAKGILIVPRWPSYPFWPILFPAGCNASFILDLLEFDHGASFLLPGKQSSSIFHPNRFRSGLLALLCDASSL